MDTNFFDETGGVALLVREGLVASELKVPGDDDRTLELLWVSVSMNKRQIVVGSLSHPPEPIYRTEELITKIENDVEWISREFCSSLIILAGDLNKIQDKKFIESTGLIAHVTQPTRGNKVLDRLYTSDDCYSSVRVLSSTVKSDHRAIFALTSRPIRPREKVITTAQIRRPPQQHATY